MQRAIALEEEAVEKRKAEHAGLYAYFDRSKKAITYLKELPVFNTIIPRKPGGEEFKKVKHKVTPPSLPSLPALHFFSCAPVVSRRFRHPNG